MSSRASAADAGAGSTTRRYTAKAATVAGIMDAMKPIIEPALLMGRLSKNW
jgi:glycerol-3-phosphate acyltransferase PlsY